MFNKISTHSHITSLNTVVGNEEARKLLLNIKTLPNCIIKLNGNGKSAFAYGTAKTNNFNPAVNKTANTSVLRDNVIVTISEQFEVLRGEVVSFDINQVVLKTTEMESTFKMSREMSKEMKRLRIEPGDTIQLNRNTGKLNKITGMVDGELIKFITTESHASLDLIDRINFEKSRNEVAYQTSDVSFAPNCYEDINTNNLLKDFTVPKFIRDEVDRKIQKWVEEGKAKIDTSIIIASEIDEVAYEMEFYKPTILLVGKNSNKLIDFVINLENLSENEKIEVIKMRLQHENLEVEEAVLNEFCKITELKIIFNLISFLKCLAKDTIATLQDFEEVQKMICYE